MEINIYGAGNNGKRIYEKINKFYSDKYTISEYIDANISGYFKGIPIVKPDNYCSDNPVVIAIENRKIALSVYKLLKNKAVKNVYLYLNLDNPHYENDDFLENECIKIIDEGDGIIHHIEIHAVDYCNLNCKACIHYAPLYSKEEFDEKIIYDDLKMLSGFTKGVLSLYIMGGEPLLRTDLPDVIRTARNLFPYSDIQVLSNGLLVPKCDDILWHTMRECKATLTISEYKPTTKLRDNIKETLIKNGVPYIIRSFDKKNKFVKTLCISNHSGYERTCICDGCINIYKGQVSRCPAVMYLYKLNDTFGLNLPNSGIYNLSDFNDVDELNKKMCENIPLCEHCINYEIDWDNCGKDCKVEDFIVME